MTPFLKSLAEKFISNDELRNELYRYRFFFQNKRAGKFFHHYLKELAPEDGLLILPEVTTLPTFLRKKQHLVEDSINNELFLIYPLYTVYRGLNEAQTRTTPEDGSDDKFQDLNSFYQFGKQILTDFNDLDLQLADHKVIFGNLQDLKDLDAAPSEYLSEKQLNALKQFIKSKRNESPFDKSFSDFYNTLSHLYENYKTKLREENLAYNGMIIRDTIEKIEAGSLNLCSDEKYNVFVGLNALSKAEKEILSHFKKSGKTTFYWDYDSSLFDIEQLAGSFKNENLSSFPEPTESDPLFLKRNPIDSYPELEVIAVPSKIGQAAYIGTELNKLASTEEGRQQLRDMKVAVVLANERLLSPLLANLDASLFLESGNETINSSQPVVNLANVTMGYSIKEFPMVGTLLRMLEIQKIRQNRNHKYWRGDEVCEILSNSIFDISSPLPKIINEKKLIFIDDKGLEKLIEENHPDLEEKQLLKLLFNVPEKEDGLLTYVSDIVNYLFSKEEESIQAEIDSCEEPEDEGVEIEPKSMAVLRIIIDLLEEQKKALSDYYLNKQKGTLIESPYNFNTLYDILSSLLKNARVPFSGEPLRGLQIMGILETRGLDFETIYIVDATDGILPANTKVMGIMPHLLRVGHELPTFKWQEQTRSYNFFRLISRAKKVVALYDSRKDGSSRGEPSRYIQQLEYVYKIPNLTRTTANFNILANRSNEHQYVIDQNAVRQFRESITSAGDRHISPTRINDYIECPRKFYFKSILGIKEVEELDDLLDESALGSLVHDTINRLYTPYIGQKMTQKLLSFSDYTIEDALRQSYKELNSGSEMPVNGINKINYDTALSLVQNLIQMDLEQILQGIAITYIGGEVEIRTVLKVCNQENNDESININLTGFIDRIDYVDGVYRIIDYKTGGDSYDLDLEKSLDLEGKSRINKAAVQLLNYCLITYHNGLSDMNGKILIKPGSTLKPLMIKPRSKESSEFKLTQGGNTLDTFNNSSIKETFEECMNDILYKIAKADSEFSPNPDRSGVCNYCPARDICPDAKITKY